MTPKTDNSFDPELEHEFELNHTDKVVGIFLEPDTTFNRISKFPPKLTDWLFPIVLLMIVTIISNISMMNNPHLQHSLMQKQLTRVENDLRALVERGDLSKAEADKQLQSVKDNLENRINTPLSIQQFVVMVAVAVPFFISAFAMFLIAKFILKGSGSYSSALVSLGLPNYIIILQVAIMTIIAMFTDVYLSGTSIASFLNMDTTNDFLGFILNKVDLFSIWFYTVTGIGLARMFNSNEKSKYISAVFILWIGSGIIFFWLAKAVPFISGMGM
ncbi:MAG: YIP1 family protein [Melioribacteraceae bacterium]|nr:YIP1 family protein [Melioribacteraceae bacterium]MCF8356681.1 YIP1 family protein [Melioribacteraceae bacterium]MCF8395551.1 YIP1 family protein [Melioribacteraceae bacterium]MCF8420851.1 YIP1 family protein [Melioribacteraceae bacterium]